MTAVRLETLLALAEYQCVAVLLTLLPVYLQWNINGTVVYQYYTACLVLHGASNFQVAVVICICFTRGHRVLSSSIPFRYRLRKHK